MSIIKYVMLILVSIFIAACNQRQMNCTNFACGLTNCKPEAKSSLEKASGMPKCRLKWPRNVRCISIPESGSLSSLLTCLLNRFGSRRCFSRVVVIITPSSTPRKRNKKRGNKEILVRCGAAVECPCTKVGDREFICI